MCGGRVGVCMRSVGAQRIQKRVLGVRPMARFPVGCELPIVLETEIGPLQKQYLS